MKVKYGFKSEAEMFRVQALMLTLAIPWSYAGDTFFTVEPREKETFSAIRNKLTLAVEFVEELVHVGDVYGDINGMVVVYNAKKLLPKIRAK